MFWFWIGLWNGIYLLLLFLVLPVSLFSEKIRKGILGRLGLLIQAGRWMRNTNPSRVITFHVASYGEFEHIRPLLKKLKKEIPCTVVALFFSPSGYLYLKDDPDIDRAFYTPLDLWPFTFSFFRLIKPVLHIIVKHDVWPTEIAVMHQLGIPVVMINASLSAKSSRFRYFRFFQRMLYRKIGTICAISEEDAGRFELHLGVDKSRIMITGDTKNDQVFLRREKAEREPLFPYLRKERHFILVAGSVWEEDWKVLREVLPEMMRLYPFFRMVVVPHELKKEFFQRMLKDSESFSPLLLETIDQMKTMEELPAVTFINRMGILAEMYIIGQVAFVGGSFKGKVHNVLEPAVYGIPVITGPGMENSTEALRLKKEGALFVVANASQFTDIMKKMVEDESFRKEAGKKAEEIIRNSLKTSETVVQLIKIELEKVVK